MTGWAIHGVWMGSLTRGILWRLGFLCNTGMTGWRLQRALNCICVTSSIELMVGGMRDWWRFFSMATLGYLMFVSVWWLGNRGDGGC